MNLLGKIEKSGQFWFLLIISVLFFFLRFPSLFEPDWYGDEGIYQTLGLGINAGRLLYRDIFDNKPPLLYLIYSVVSSDQFLIRLLSLLFGLFALLAFYLLCKKILNTQNNRPAFISTFVFAVLFGLPLLEGNIANAENFMLLPNIIAAIFVWKALDTTNRKSYMLLMGGFILGISFLFKIIALFDFAAFSAFIVFVNYSGSFLSIFRKDNLVREIKNLLPFLIGFLTPIILTSLYFLINNAFPSFLQAVLFNNIGYVNYGNKFIIPQGLLIFKLILLSAFCLFLFSKRKAYGNAFTFSALWIGFSLFNAYFSQRPYTHYVLVLLPSFCLLVGLFLVKRNFSKTAGALIVTSLILIIISFTFFLRTIFYYQNFVLFIAGAKTVSSYQSFFDGNTPRDYELASFLNAKLKPNENVFIWGNNAQIYKLTNKLPPGKYTVAYHILNYKDGFDNTEKMLNVQKPRFIVIMPNVPLYPFNLGMYVPFATLDNIQIYEKIY